MNRTTLKLETGSELPADLTPDQLRNAYLGELYGMNRYEVGYIRRNRFTQWQAMDTYATILASRDAESSNTMFTAPSEPVEVVQASRRWMTVGVTAWILMLTILILAAQIPVIFAIAIAVIGLFAQWRSVDNSPLIAEEPTV